MQFFPTRHVQPPSTDKNAPIGYQLATVSTCSPYRSALKEKLKGLPSDDSEPQLLSASERNLSVRIQFLLAIMEGSIQMKTLADIFEHTLQDIYYAENAITKALPKVAKAATDAKLKKAVDDHLAETKGQIVKLDEVFKSIGLKPKGEKCDAIEGLIKEADGLIEEASGTALDAGLLAACQALEHYEISRYGSLREWAKDLGHDEAHKLLSEILDQEKAAN